MKKNIIFFIFLLISIFIGNCLIYSDMSSQNLYKIKYDISNPMKHLSNKVKIRDITQIMSHDSLCILGKMRGRTKSTRFFSSAMLANLIGLSDYFAACQKINLKDQAKLGVTTFDIRVARPKSDQCEYSWVPHHNGIVANLNALDELISLFLYSQLHPESVYIIKLRVENNDFDEFLEDLNSKVIEQCSKSLNQFIFTPDDVEGKKDIINITLGDIHKVKKNIIIMIDNKNNLNTNLVFNGQTASGYRWSQTLKYSNKSLIDFVIKTLKYIREKDKNKFMYVSPAHTLGIGIIYGAAYLSPLKDAEDNNEEIVDLMINKLSEEKIKLQSLGLNGIGINKKILYDIIDYSNSCIYSEYRKAGFNF